MFDKIAEYWQALKDFLFSLLLSFQTMIKDAFIWFFDSLMDLVISALNGLGDLFASLNIFQYIDALPVDVKNVMALIGLDVATSMIVASILIRILLQLIPFTRLGS